MERVSKFLSPDRDHFKNISSRSRKAKQPAPEEEGLRAAIFEDPRSLNLAMDIVKLAAAVLSSPASLGLLSPRSDVSGVFR